MILEYVIFQFLIKLYSDGLIYNSFPVGEDQKQTKWVHLNLKNIIKKCKQGWRSINRCLDKKRFLEIH